MSVSYSRINWEAYPSTTTKITAERLNVMDKGIDDCANAINNINATNVLTDASISGSGSTVTTSISKGTALEDIAGTLVNNDYALNANVTDLRNDITATTTENAIPNVEGFTATFQHCGGVVLLDFGGNGTLPATQGEEILRGVPRANVYTPIFLHDASSGDIIRLGVDTSGHIYNSTTGVTCSPRGTAIYFTNQFD